MTPRDHFIAELRAAWDNADHGARMLQDAQRAAEQGDDKRCSQLLFDADKTLQMASHHSRWAQDKLRGLQGGAA